jgi:thioredoxin reductase
MPVELGMTIDNLKSERMSYPDSLEAIEDDLYAKGMTDGLPIIPPTPERVRAMIEFNGLDPAEVIADKFPPQNGIATIEKIAINAVMAGCRPEHLPVVIAAVEAMTSQGFDLFGVQATTHPCGMIVFINGPIRNELDINCGSGAMGPGWRANATIGRAIRLCMFNLGGAAPGPVDKSTQGTPAKYTFCFGENEEESPFPPFHVSRGFAAEDSTVTVLGLEGPQDINGQDATTADSFLRILASSLISAGTSNFRFTTGSDLWIFLGPEHALIMARDGVTREQIQDYLFEHARVPVEMFTEEHIAKRLSTPGQHGEWDGVSAIPVVRDKENFLICTVGGAGLHSSWSPSWGGPRHRAATAKIRKSRIKAEEFDVLVIGQGYAGLSAAKLAAERGLRTANFESECMGGLVLNLNELDPPPSAEEDVAGFELASNFAMQNLERGVMAVSDAVVSVERDGERWIVRTDTERFAAPSVIVASGGRLRKLDVPGEEEFFGQGVSECADCDGPMFTGKECVVIGGGDSAFQEAVSLSHHASKVTVLMRGDAPRARAEWIERVRAIPTIELVANTHVVAINGSAGTGVESVRVADARGERDLPCAGVFIFIGLEPNTGFLPQELERDATGAIVTDDTCASPLPGLWVIGSARSRFPGLLSDAAVDAAVAVAAVPAHEIA